MAGKLKNCPECGKLFMDMGSRICRDCLEREDELMVRVSSFVRDHPHSTIKDIVEGVEGVKERLVRRMIKEGRFVEHTLYNGNYYGSTKDQIAPNKCVVIDPAGLRSYINLHNKNIITFYLEADEETRHKRMITRGDAPEKIKSRIENDRIAFRPENIAKVDYVIDASNNKSIEQVAAEIYQHYINHEKRKN